jgi:hypothetical protein
MIELNRAEQWWAKYLAKARQDNNAANPLPNGGKIGNQSEEITDLEGIGAEIAFCKNFNVWLDTDIGEERPDFDVVLKDGRKVDIKTTRYESGHLIANRKKAKHPPDAYALMVGTFPRYRFAGSISAARLLQEKNLVDFGYGLTYAVSQDELKK